MITTIIMVDSNIQRENIATERGFAYKMKVDAMIRQSGET